MRIAKDVKLFQNIQPLEIQPLFNRWYFDILMLPESREGYMYLLLFIESLTRFLEPFPLKDQIAQTASGILFD